MRDKVPTFIRYRNVHGLTDLNRFAFSRCNNAARVVQSHSTLHALLLRITF
jgi:hypothetical protein